MSFILVPLAIVAYMLCRLWQPLFTWQDLDRDGIGGLDGHARSWILLGIACAGTLMILAALLCVVLEIGGAASAAIKQIRM